MRAWSSFLSLALALLYACALANAQRGNRLKSTEASDIDRGQKIYEKSCAVCHFSTSPEKKIGPGMKGIMKKGKFANGWKVNDENMRRWIEAGGKNMPPSRLNAEQIRELLAYLKTL
ncbi:MAG TPA: cytochrome c [Candidatus Acidoferrales bacterium]|nr:cytochrome c [Candidatus Acidoferrales bacterium]